MENNKKMKKILLFLLVICTMLSFGQGGAGGDRAFGVIEGTINASMYGGATYYIPIDIPQGVQGMQPSLGIVYNSQSGNGLLGYGWNISGISTISRVGSTLYHNGIMTAADFSEYDCFMLDGQRLIFVEGSGNSYEYKTENDEFSKIIFTKENGYFSKCEVRLENGNILKYGYTNDSKLMDSDGDNVIKWSVSSIEDRNGNTISYVYETSGANSDIYIKQIEYTSNTLAGLTAQYLIEFTYNNRFDDYHYYIAGNKVKSDRILSRIEVSRPGRPIASYDFSYDGNTNRMYNLLTEITYSRGSKQLDPILIQWNTDNNDIQNNELYSHEINSSILDEFTFIGDFNGDGYSDLLTVPYKPIYGYSDSVTAKIYLNNQNGGFNSTPNGTRLLSQNLEWVHVLDMNGDGFDDIVAQSKTTTYDGNNAIYHSGFTIYESQNGNGFEQVFNTIIDSTYYVRSGDFLGEGRNSLILLKLIGVDDIDDNYIINGYPSIIHYDNGYFLDTFVDNIIDMGVVISDDFNGDGKTEIVVFDSYRSTNYSFYKQSNAYRILETFELFDNDYEYASYFSGDFNNDGKADVLFNDNTNNKYIVLSTGSGFSNWISINNNALHNVNLPYMHTYKHSLNNISPNTSYGVSLSDTDGDGKTDIIFYDGNHNPVFFRDFHVSNSTENSGYFSIEFHADNTDIKFKNQYFTIGNFLGEDRVSYIAVDPQNPTLTNDDKVKIFSLPSTNQRYSVSSITSGFGKTTSIEYEYLMPGNNDFYSFANRPYWHKVKPCPMPMMAMKSYTEHIGSNYYKTSFKYGNALLHRTGRGFVNFESVEKTSYINNVAVKKEKCKFEITTMNINATALPQCDSTFLFCGGNPVISETNVYNFQNVRCSRALTKSGVRTIVRPALIAQKTKHFSLDAPGQLLSVDIAEYTYNYINDGSYSNTYGCTDICTGVNGADCNSAASCGYKTNTHITYKNNNYIDWIINRKSEEVSVADYMSKPSITRKTRYEYSSGNPYQVSQKTIVPSSNDVSPLTVRYTYLYDACGNISSETTSAPYGTQYELPMMTSYKYDNYRLTSTKAKDPSGLNYQELYIYDGYDRITKHTGSNGLITKYQYHDPFDNIVDITAPDNTTTSQITTWASSTNMSPAGAVYYKHTQTTGNAPTMIFYDAFGNAIRTITWNYENEPVIVDTYYDEKQLIIQKSHPYIYGDTPQWIVYEYDDFGRLISTTHPDGSVTYVIYNGYITTTTTDTGSATHSVVQTTNYLGWVTRNTDASNNSTVTYDYYSDGTLATMTTSGGDVVVEMEYDDAGNRISLDDPDYGFTSYLYNAYRQLKRQTTPKNNQILYYYDALGRVTQTTVTGDETTTSYLYNENTHKGTLASIVHTGQTLNYTYDQYDRLVATNDIRTDTTYSTTFVYGSNSKLAAKRYPSGYKVLYEYYSDGTLQKIKDVGEHTLWQTDDINACGQLLQATTGNGAVTTNTYNVLTNRLLGSATSNGIQNFAYTFDGFGNLTSRTDSIGVIKTETFTYDNLDRLTGITLNNVSSTMVYDSYGRMTGKEKEGATVFTSAQFSGTKPHATTSASAALNVFPTDQTISYNALDKIVTIGQDGKIAQFTYGYDAQRIRMVVTDTLINRTRTKDYVGNCEFVNDNGRRKVYTYLTGPYGVFAVVVNSGNGNEVNYIYKDHLGSWTTIADSIGNIVERRSFDAWGNLRNPITWSGTPNRPPKFDRGFTGHEHLFAFGLINMNGRMYDPLLSSFLSPDNYMQNPTSQQGFNRYAYCMYNPLKYVDPSGEQYYGWDPSLAYRMEQEAKAIVRNAWQQCYDSGMASHHLTIAMANCLYGHGEDTQGNGSGNHGSPGGGDRPNNQRPLIFIRTVTTDNDLPPIYNFILFNSDESSGNNTSYFSELKKFAEENTKYFFIDGKEALEFMYENSFDEYMNSYKEIAAWVVDEGIIVQPWYENTATVSYNHHEREGDDYYFNGKKYQIIAQIHTHPNYNNGDIGVSQKDRDMIEIRPVYIIYNSSLYKVGDPTIRLDQIRNINYYNWRNYFKY